MALQLFEVGKQRSVRELGGLRWSRGPRGEQQHREVARRACRVVRAPRPLRTPRRRAPTSAARTRRASSPGGPGRHARATRRPTPVRRSRARARSPARAPPGSAEPPPPRPPTSPDTPSRTRARCPPSSATRSPGATRAASSEVARAERAAISPWDTGSPVPTRAGRSGVVAAAPSSAATRFIGRGGWAGRRARNVATKRTKFRSRIAPSVSLERHTRSGVPVGVVGGVVVAGKFPESSAHAASQPAPPTSTTAAGPLSCDHRARLRSGASCCAIAPGLLRGGCAAIGDCAGSRRAHSRSRTARRRGSRRRP